MTDIVCFHGGKISLGTDFPCQCGLILDLKLDGTTEDLSQVVHGVLVSPEVKGRLSSNLEESLVGIGMKFGKLQREGEWPGEGGSLVTGGLRALGIHAAYLDLWAMWYHRRVPKREIVL